eukprot:TRINITY_DN82432_c0_g1_i1.p1 TRINITY_DN82432_c0_g1~~TRINITY_DN82432_c0_g1_i1.p1  ORF type:complete len:774 (+),score=172.73 TRINITY_DN82432_c0_g1_i1:94-2415(+)
MGCASSTANTDEGSSHSKGSAWSRGKARVNELQAAYNAKRDALEERYQNTVDRLADAALRRLDPDALPPEPSKESAPEASGLDDEQSEEEEEPETPVPASLHDLPKIMTAQADAPPFKLSGLQSALSAAMDMDATRLKLLKKWWSAVGLEERPDRPLNIVFQGDGSAIEISVVWPLASALEAIPDLLEVLPSATPSPPEPRLREYDDVAAPRPPKQREAEGSFWAPPPEDVHVPVAVALEMRPKAKSKSKAKARPQSASMPEPDASPYIADFTTPAASPPPEDFSSEFAGPGLMDLQHGERSSRVSASRMRAERDLHAAAQAAEEERKIQEQDKWLDDLIAEKSRIKQEVKEGKMSPRQDEPQEPERKPEPNTLLQREQKPFKQTEQKPLDHSHGQHVPPAAMTDSAKIDQWMTDESMAEPMDIDELLDSRHVEVALPAERTKKSQGATRRSVQFAEEANEVRHFQVDPPDSPQKATSPGFMDWLTGASSTVVEDECPQIPDDRPASQFHARKHVAEAVPTPPQVDEVPVLEAKTVGKKPSVAAAASTARDAAGKWKESLRVAAREMPEPCEAELWLRIGGLGGPAGIASARSTDIGVRIRGSSKCRSGLAPCMAYDGLAETLEEVGVTEEAGWGLAELGCSFFSHGPLALYSLVHTAPDTKAALPQRLLQQVAPEGVGETVRRIAASTRDKAAAMKLRADLHHGEASLGLRFENPPEMLTMDLALGENQLFDALLLERLRQTLATVGGNTILSAIEVRAKDPGATVTLRLTT